MKFLVQGIFISLLLSVFTASAQSFTQTIKGRVIDKQSQSPLTGATLKVINTSLGSVSDEDGYFKIENVNIGRVTVEISYLGYKPVTLSNLILSSAKELVLEIEMEENIIEAQEVVVTASEDKINTNNDMATVSARTFTIEEAERYAGARQDVARMASNFAGVQGTNDAVNDIVIRGNSPIGLLWRLEGVDIPNPNHFGDFGGTGGPVSMLNTNVLSNSDFLTSAFPADYGNAYSGVFDLKLRNGNDEHHEFLGQFGLNGLELGAEGPLSKKNHSSYLINYRYSTLGILSALGFDFGTGTAIPYYQDVSFKLNFPSEKIGRISVFGLGGANHLDLLAEDLGDENLYIDRKVNYSGKDRLGLLGISHTYLFDNNSYTKLTLAYTYTYTGDDVDSLSVVDAVPHDFYNSNLSERKIFASFYFNKKFSAKNVVRAGIYGARSDFNIADSVFLASENNFRILSDYGGGLSLLQPYITWQFRPNDQITFNSGLHSMYLDYNGSYSVEPRFGIKYQLTEKQSLSLGYGLHGMMAPVYNYFRTSSNQEDELIYPNQKLDFMKSRQLVLGYDHNFSNTLRLKIETYYQHLFDVVVEQALSSYSIVNQGGLATSSSPDSLDNDGTGENYGAEVTFEKFLDRGFYFLFTASVFDSKYIGSDGILRNTAWNSHYLTNFLIGRDVELNKNAEGVKSLKELTFDLKVTYGGGRWYTPVDIEASLAGGETKFYDALAFTQRFPNYFRLDVRAGIRMQGRKVSQEFALDIQNLTNQMNPLYQRVDLSTGEIKTVNQLGIFPVALYRIEF